MTCLPKLNQNYHKPLNDGDYALALPSKDIII